MFSLQLPVGFRRTFEHTMYHCSALDDEDGTHGKPFVSRMKRNSLSSWHAKQHLFCGRTQTNEASANLSATSSQLDHRHYASFGQRLAGRAVQGAREAPGQRMNDGLRGARVPHKR
jgi:hypothetical protein